jgi:hypothetical protein
MIKMKSGRSSGSAFTPIAFPLLPTVACRIDVTSTGVEVGYTATGIAPDLHRTSLLIPAMRRGNRLQVQMCGNLPQNEN